MQTNLEKCFVLQGLKLGHRIDGRGLHEQRPLEFEFGTKDGHCIARLGETVACACVTGTLERPLRGRPSEGSVSCRVKTAAKRGSKQRDVDIMMERFLERSLKESKAIDLESLCVQSGRFVWHIQLNLTVMSDDGNVLDVLGYAALGGLRVFKRPDVTVDRSAPGGLTIHSLETREGIPLTFHHIPVTSTFASYVFEEDDQQIVLLDPAELEQVTSHGLVMISVTPQGEVCAVQKADGCGMSRSDILWCMRMGMNVAKNACQKLDDALKKHAVDRVASRVVRKTETECMVHRVGIPTAVSLDRLPENVKHALEESRQPMIEDEDHLDAAIAEQEEQEEEDGEDDGQEQQQHDMPLMDAPSGWKQRRYSKSAKPQDNDIYIRASESVAKQAGDSEQQDLQGALKKP